MIQYNQTACLIYPGMTSFQEVFLIGPADEPGFVLVRVEGEIKPRSIHASRIVDHETAARRTHTQIIERKDDMGRYVATETSVTA